jgi:hypothetical protein
VLLNVKQVEVRPRGRLQARPGLHFSPTTAVESTEAGRLQPGGKLPARSDSHSVETKIVQPIGTRVVQTIETQIAHPVKTDKPVHHRIPSV